MHKLFVLLSTAMILAPGTLAQETSEQALTINPSFRWLTESSPYGDLRLTNAGTVALEVTLTASGLDPDSATGSIGDLSPHLTVFPPRLILEPGETRLARYAILDLAPIPRGGHVTFVRARMARRTPVEQARAPATATALRVTYELIVPLILIRDEATLDFEVTMERQEDEMLILGLTNHGDSPWPGQLHVQSVDGQLLGSSDLRVQYERREWEIAVQPPLPDTLLVTFETLADYVPAHLFPPLPPLLITR